MKKLGRPRLATEKKCVQCAKVFMPIGTRSRRFCGLKCRDAHTRAKRVNATDGTARCAKCREWKPLPEFVRGIKGRPHSYCKPCSSDWFAARRGTVQEKRRPYRPAYRLTDEQKRENKRAANHMQHQARRAAGPRPLKADIDSMLCRQDARCSYCRELLSGPFHIDHKTPVSRGGRNDLENLQLTCARCNLRKGAMTHDEFLASKRRRVTSWK